MTLSGDQLAGIVDTLRAMWEWYKYLTGMTRSCGAEPGVCYRIDPDVEVPDMELKLIIGNFDDHACRSHLGHT